VTALEEERRRVRRDVHDGLGPRLSGIAFTADAARNLLRVDPAATDALLAALRAETVAAIKEVREIAYGLRPPALDELGLVPAIRQQTARLRTPDGQPFLVHVDTVELPALTAATEVAAYRIAVEALTNAARHSGGSSARTCIGVDGAHLVVEVRDEGSSGDPWGPGVGTASMRERAAELGGFVALEPSTAGGSVRALLPLGAAGDGSRTA
jgi:signal transduction histidine kinase